ncbi:hypothetical protein EPO17_03645 [Patescibacteria group bacterium]|nr:MAG: hypothetical protein EPO17_03645 [Patescibacteria group bacterium]
MTTTSSPVTLQQQQRQQQTPLEQHWQRFVRDPAQAEQHPTIQRFLRAVFSDSDQPPQQQHQQQPIFHRRGLESIAAARQLSIVQRAQMLVYSGPQGAHFAAGTPMRFAPQIDPGAWQRSLFLQPLLSTDINAATKARIRRLHEACKQQPGYVDETSFVAYVTARYKPSTAIKYVNTLLSLHRELTQNEGFMMARMHLRMMAVERARVARPGAMPATIEQVKTLIGDLSTPEQRVVLQIFIAAARSREMLLANNLDSESDSDSDSDTDRAAAIDQIITPPAPRACDFKVWEMGDNENTPCAEYNLLAHKSAKFGNRPFSRWVRLPKVAALRRRWKQLLEPQGVKYRDLLKYIKSKTPALSSHSLRKGAIQFLKDSGATAREITTLTGHSERVQVNMMAVYAVVSPQQPEAIAIMDLTSKLLRAVGHDTTDWW